jgi:hypothetical protein
VLSFTRRDAASRTSSFLGRVDAFSAAVVNELTNFGPVYLNPAELAAKLDEATTEYYRMLGRGVFEFRGQEFWNYHTRHLASMGHSINYARVAYHSIARVVDMALNPKRTIEGAARRVRRLLQARRTPSSTDARAQAGAALTSAIS